MLIDHSNRTYLVTGAGSGIGRATAISLAASGAHVWVLDLNEDAAFAVANEIDDNGGKATAIGGDTAEPERWISALSDVGQLHGIVHAAGYDVVHPFESTPIEQFDRLIKVMVTGPFRMTQSLIPHMARANGSCVLYISSVHALATEPGVNTYAACKAAQIAMVRSMAQDLGPKRIRALTIAPGYIDTPLLNKGFDTEPDPAFARAQAQSIHPLGRIGTPEDIAYMATFLLSPLAEFVNGTTVVVDGSLTAQLRR